MSGSVLTPPATINLVADLGEGFGDYRVADDEALLEIVSSANVACGFHAGDPVILERTVRRCAELGVAVGAHPGFDDRRNFGRVRIELPREQLYADVLYQLGAIKAFTDRHGVPLTHVSPHGRLGNLCSAEEYYAEPVLAAIHDFDPSIRVGGSSTSLLARTAAAAGHPVLRSGLPDRNYEPDGSLVRRTQPNALVEDPAEIVERAVRMILHRTALAVDGSEIPVECDTILLHGDKPEALDTARALQSRLIGLGITIAAL